MSDERRKQIEHIQALLAERRKIERWLEGLDTRRSSAPLHVVQRVESDYRAKLEESQARLSNETGAVQSLVTELEGALAVQARAVTAKQDERAESELRAAVGEFAEKEWDKLKAKLDAAIAALEGERDGIQKELDTMRALLEDAGSVAAPAPSPAPAAHAAAVSAAAAPAEPSTHAATSAAPAEPVAATEAAPEPAVVPPATAERAPAVAEPVPAAAAPVEAKKANADPGPATVDELAFLRNVLGGTTPPGSQPPSPASSPASSPAASSASADSPASPPPRESVAAPRPATRPSGFSRPSTGSQKAVEPDMFSLPEPPMPMSEDQARESGGFQRLSGQFGALGANTPRTTEAVKSLKCGECGTLNYPTEWYCERCGGELAAF